MSNLNDEVCEYNYSTPVTENFSCAINNLHSTAHPHVKAEKCVSYCDKANDFLKNNGHSIHHFNLTECYTECGKM